MSFAERVEADGVSISPQGVLTLTHRGVPLRPASAFADTSYERPKGAKVLNRAVLDPDFMETQPSRALQKYDHLFGVDTNGNAALAVSALVKVSFDSQGERTYAFWEAKQAIELRDIVGAPERVAWRAIIQALMLYKGYDPAASFGLIVDSDLESIPAYNARHLPIDRSFFLPENFELVYGTADAGSEYVPNRVISMCDDIAGWLLGAIQKNFITDDGLEESEDPAFRLWRGWAPGRQG